MQEKKNSEVAVTFYILFHSRNGFPYILDHKGSLKCYFLDLSAMHLRVNHNQSKEDRKTTDDSEAGRQTHTCVRLVGGQ